MTTDHYRVVAPTIDRRDGRELPGPSRHAAKLLDEETLCGSPVATMNRFDHLPYHELDPVLRCRDCSVTFDKIVIGL